MSDAKTTKVATRCGVQLKPPALILIYEVRVGKVATKTKQLVMPVRNFRQDSNVVFEAECLHARHLTDIGGMPIMQMERMLRIIQEHLKGMTLAQALDTVNKEFSFPVDCPDFNRIPPDMYRRMKEIMELDYAKRAIAPSDADYVYDKRVEFAAPQEATDWDSTGDETDSIVDDVWE